MLRFVVEKQYMRAYGEQAYDGTINYFSASFEFSPEWDGRDKYAIFTPEAGNAYIAHLVDDKIQQEVGFDLPAGKYKVTVYGDTIEGTEATGRITAGKPTICIDPIEFMNGEPLPPVPPTIAEQIAANAESARRIAQSVRDDADSGVFDGVSPEVITEEIEDGTRITIIDRDGEHTFELHNGENAVDHNLLTNRDDPNAHPISAITGLEHELELKQDVIGDLEEIRERARMVLDKADRSEIPTGTSDLVNDAGFLTNATVPVKSVNGKTGDVNITPGDIGIGTVFELKGSVQRKGQLPYSGNKVGDVWYVIDESVGYIWLNDGYGPRWEQLGPSIDLSAYALKSEVPTKISDLPQDPQHETVTYEQKQRWSAKQDAISDLSTIRSNAQKASTAVQPHDLATVATTGSYNDLINQPEVVHPSDLATVATTGSYNDLTDKPSVFGNEVEVGPTPEDADLWIDTSESGSNVDPSVRWDVEQHLDHTSRARARGNIGATLRELLNEDYTVEQIILPSSSLTVQTQFGMKFARFRITGAAGNRIVMTLDGTKYECDRGTYSDSNDTPFRYYYGNASIYNFAFDNTEEPFVLFTTGIENSVAMLILRSDYAESTATVSITTYDAYANRIPYANMPGGYPTISIGETYALFDGDYFVSEDYGNNNTLFNKDYAYTVNFENSIHHYEPTDIHSFTEGDYSGYYIGNGSLNTWADVPGPDTGEGYCLAFYEGEEDYVYFFFADDEPHRIGCFVHHPDVIDKIDDRFVKVNDVQVNGASVVTDGVANVPQATSGAFGVVKSGGYGLNVDSITGQMYAQSFTAGQYASWGNNLVLSKGTLNNVLAKPSIWPTLTAEEQAAARERMGIVTITQEEYDLISVKSESTIYVIVG